ncbi:D12 class N6 adenine-specific DNA methyltransferase [uncultured archaeon]|nr:D12 class N6 adenine-specific DNA methyltransferase [uncultured archaeon]
MSETLQKQLRCEISVKESQKNITIPTFIKWAGGKTQLLNQFVDFFPKKFNKYFEPFLGSGAVFYYIKNLYPDKEFFLSDNNKELIHCYEIIQNDLEGLLDLLKEHRSKHCKEYYYYQRSVDTKNLSKIEAVARFIYLNKTCFNGLFRVNSKGKFNVPIGSYKNPSIFQEKDLREAQKLLQGVTIKTMPFEEIINITKQNDFVYFDPPYYPLSTTSSFTSYTSKSFSEKDQRSLADVYRELDKKGCQIMLSNSYSDFILELYSDYRIEKVSAKRMINCNGNGRGAIAEAVVLNY